jgi:SAM-dependent methyltransferase
MVSNRIRFDDGAAYEQYMGKWSQLAGETFLDWLAPKSGLRWLDVGCGNGAFTEMLVERCAPISVQGIDPSEAQLAFARTRPASRVAQFRQGDAAAQPFLDDSFDAAVMPLVIFIETREIAAQRTFADFDDYWTTILMGPSVGPNLAAMASEAIALLKARMRARLPIDATGRITYSARANAVKGRVPNQF